MTSAQCRSKKNAQLLIASLSGAQSRSHRSGVAQSRSHRSGVAQSLNYAQALFVKLFNISTYIDIGIFMKLWINCKSYEIRITEHFKSAIQLFQSFFIYKRSKNIKEDSLCGKFKKKQ